MKQQLIQYSFLCSSKEKDEKKGRPGKACILVHWLFFGNFRTHPPMAGSHSLKFCSSNQPLTRGFSGDYVYIKSACLPSTALTLMPCEGHTANARKRSQTPSVLCVSVSRRTEQDKAVCRAEWLFLFPYLFQIWSRPLDAKHSVKIISPP